MCGGRFPLVLKMCAVLALIALSEANPAEPLDDNRLELSDIAREIVGRSATNSQVLSLNLTNLVILLVLKGLLFGAAMLGGHQKGRRADFDEPFLSEPEMMLITSYLLGDEHSCLYRVACQEQAKAKQYLAAAKILLKAGKIFDGVVPFDPNYEKLVNNIQEAVTFGAKYGTCQQQYKCSDHRNINNERKGPKRKK